MDLPHGTDLSTTAPSAPAGSPGYYSRGNPDPAALAYPSVVDAYHLHSLQMEILGVIDGCGLTRDAGNLGQMWAGLNGYFAPQISPILLNSLTVNSGSSLILSAIAGTIHLAQPTLIDGGLVVNFGPANGYSMKLQADGTVAWYAPSGVQLGIGSTGAYATALFTALADLAAKADVIVSGGVGVQGGISQNGPADRKFQSYGDLTGGYNPCFSKFSGTYINNGVNAYAVSGAPCYFGTGVDAGPVVEIVGNGSQGVIGSISTNKGQTGVLFNTTSDYRLKADVQALEGATERLNRLRPLSFSMIHDPDRARQSGFIAHEFGVVYPLALTGEKDAVQTMADGSEAIRPQQIDRTAVIPDLVAAVQGLLADNASLRARLDALEGGR